MPHEKDRPCLDCALRRLLVQFQVKFGYETNELIENTVRVLADLAANGATTGHEREAQETIRVLFDLNIRSSFKAEAQARAANAAGPKAPTTTDVGHA